MKKIELHEIYQKACLEKSVRSRKSAEDFADMAIPLMAQAASKGDYSVDIHLPDDIDFGDAICAVALRAKYRKAVYHFGFLTFYWD